MNSSDNSDESAHFTNQALLNDEVDELFDFPAFSEEEVALNSEYNEADYEENIIESLMNASGLDSVIETADDNINNTSMSNQNESEIESDYEMDSEFEFEEETEIETEKQLETVTETIERLFAARADSLNVIHNNNVDIVTQHNFYVSKQLASDLFASCYEYKDKPYNEDDFLKSDKDLLEDDIIHLKNTFLSHERRVKKYFDFASVYVSEIGLRGGKTAAFSKAETDFNMQQFFILVTIEDLFDEKLSILNEKMNDYLENEDAYSLTLNAYVAERRDRLRSVLSDINEVEEIVEEERAYMAFKAKMKTVKFRPCPLLDKMTDEACVDRFRFRKQHIKTLARIFNILPRYKCTFLKTVFRPDGSTFNKRVSISVKCDPVVQLMILLERQAHGTPLNSLENFYSFKKTKINDIERALYCYIYNKFSHLLCITNCQYTTKYMTALVSKSKLYTKSVEPKTCYLLDGTHINICKPTRRGNQNMDPTYSEKKGSNTLKFQMLTDIFGLFIEVGKPEVGSCENLKMLKESGLLDRLPLLMADGEQLKVLGDAAYVDEGTRLHEQIVYVSKRSDTTSDPSKIIPRENSSARCAVERSFGLTKTMHKSHVTTFRNKVFVTDIPLRVIVSCLISNARQIWYKTTTSGVLSNILPPEAYFLLWGRGSKEILHDRNEKKKQIEFPLEIREAAFNILNGCGN